MILRIVSIRIDWIFAYPDILISVKVWGRNATIGGVELAPKYTAHFIERGQYKKWE